MIDTLQQDLDKEVNSRKLHESSIKQSVKLSTSKLEHRVKQLQSQVMAILGNSQIEVKSVVEAASSSRGSSRRPSEKFKLTSRRDLSIRDDLSLVN